MTKPPTITTTIRGCSRCSRDHQDLTFSRMDRPIVIHSAYDYYASCPNTGEPILLQYDVGKSLPKAEQIQENPDLFLHLAKANQEMGGATVELIGERDELRQRVEKLEGLIEWEILRVGQHFDTNDEILTKDGTWVGTNRVGQKVPDDGHTYLRRHDPRKT